MDQSIVPPAQTSAHAEPKTAELLSTREGTQRQHQVWASVQRGLIYPSPHALFATFFRRPSGDGKPLTKPILQALMRDVRHAIHQRWPSANTTAIVGVGFRLWQEWCTEEGTSPPEGMRLLFPEPQGGAWRSTVFARSNGTFVDSQGDLWFHIKSDNPEHCPQVFAFIRERLVQQEQCARIGDTDHEEAHSKAPNPDGRGGKVLGCRFSENLNNPTDPLSLQEQTLVGSEDPAREGASFVLAQRFLINWEHLLHLTPQQVEDLVGRTTEDILIPSRDERSHIKSARVQDAQGNTLQVLRLGLPFGEAGLEHNQELVAKGASRRDEKGLYFAGYARSVRVLEAIMDNQIGGQSGFMRDRLLSEMRANLGGFYYVPNRAELGLEREHIPLKHETNWRRFPGVNWERLDRHFNVRSANGYMAYNHKDYLFRMSTLSGPDIEKYLPPSPRVLQLLGTAFSRWQDNWYFDRAQREMEHLCAYVARTHGPAKAREVMNLPVMERMGWAIKVSLGEVFTSDAYGFRGRRQDAHQNWYNGADTYSLRPEELIVGAMPNLGLGQGRYVIDYTREDEQLPNFFAGLSPASGVGHLVPGFQRALDKGLEALAADTRARRDRATDAKKRSFYAAAALALEGVQDYCRAYARLATEQARSFKEQGPEWTNLQAIAARLTSLATQPPQTMLEAAQLLFVLHACLHLIGEPTAVGRLDQMLFPFYEKDVAAGRLNDTQAQEIIDCFWVKLGEKVQLNRQFVEDHQPAGNLAMGGSSGNYPQGAANNQWIQQVTVGGTVADDAPGEGTPAYNKITLFCLRAARRLPLNAPCLSLRVRKDIPAEYLHEAALAILSGGAHPLLLSDEKLIPGLLHCGDRVGEGTTPTAFTPVSQKAQGTWRNHVTLQAARDYACDGCYEPQFVGQSWFTLGGVSALMPLEAALNQGKSWASAGPMYFRGTRVSFSSPPPREITSYAQLEALFLQHLRWMYAKQADGLLSVFGTMSAVCPSPLLSVFVDDCLDKGLDLYDGGARYHVVAPCFTGLSTAINSLYAIQKMVFDKTTAVTSLPELVEALICDWGYKMDEPFVSTLAGPARIGARAERFQKLRAEALTQPRFGRSQDAAFNDFARGLLKRVADTALSVFTEPAEPTAEKMVRIAERFGTKDQPFGGFQLQPGTGTFENYVEFGASCGASADGRRLGQPLASDLSPTPALADLPVAHQEMDFGTSLASIAGTGADAFTSGAPTDFNIREDFPLESLERVLQQFAQGRGANILTVTCANPETLAAAARDPEKYDVLRVRMGGWSEFFVAMYPAHQEQHQRRPFSDASTPE
ncbi:Dyp-type peroxidase [Melittangium boletus]|uniref:Dyp-type peroxidase n=1 Tax=Melittangium boletus TaxID=83453 RepID=UPI003DA619E3